jgi:hypothetical protein
MSRVAFTAVLMVPLVLMPPTLRPASQAAEPTAPTLRAGVAKVDIAAPPTGPCDAPLYARALVLSDGQTTAVLVSVDAVAIGEIGPIRNNYLGAVRSQIEKDLGIRPGNILVNASHCHGQICTDVDQRTVQAVKEAWGNRVPVDVGAGSGHEDRVMENRRLRLKNGSEVDMRRAYSLPPDEDIAAVGPVDPQIGILRLDKKDGQPLAVVYNFACHPIQGSPSGGNTGDLTGFASRVIEENLAEGAVALFVQGCGGDVNPVRYKDVDHPRDAEPLGNMLGLSTLKAVRKVACRDNPQLRVLNETLELPRADHVSRIDRLRAQQARLVQSLKGTDIDLNAFLSLSAKHQRSAAYPSFGAQGYLHDKTIGREDWNTLDANNRKSIEQYARNIRVMEELTRVQANIALLEKRQAQNAAAGKRTIDAEVAGLRVGHFVLVTFPGELSVQIGLNIKNKSPHKTTFVAACTNGYIYYAPTEEQLANPGCAQEDCDCLLAPGWQALFEKRVAETLEKL